MTDRFLLETTFFGKSLFSYQVKQSKPTFKKLQQKLPWNLTSSYEFIYGVHKMKS